AERSAPSQARYRRRDRARCPCRQAHRQSPRTPTRTRRAPGSRSDAAPRSRKTTCRCAMTSSARMVPLLTDRAAFFRASTGALALLHSWARVLRFGWLFVPYHAMKAQGIVALSRGYASGTTVQLALDGNGL